MIILHAGYLAGELILWGEKPVQPGGVVLARRGRQPRVPKPLPSPYDAGASAVSEALRETAGLKLGPTQTGVPTVVWLPTVAGKPAANDTLIAERPAPEAPVSLAPLPRPHLLGELGEFPCVPRHLSIRRAQSRQAG